MENTIDRLTGLRLELTTTVPLPPPALWTLVTDIPAIGRWSPECIAATWHDGITGPTPGARFRAENRFGTVVRAVEGVVTEVVPERSFAWTVLDDEDGAGSLWRYDLSPAAGGTCVHHSWEHGPGMTGMRDDARRDRTSVDRRLGVLASHMHGTLVAMERQALGEVA